MKLQQRDSHQFSNEAPLQAVGLLHGKDILVLNETGEVVLYRKEENEETVLLNVAPKKGIQYEDGGFIPTEKSSIRVMDDMFFVSNDYKTHCYFCDVGKGYSLNIQREDYCAEISKFPVALFKRDGVKYMLYSKQWNRVDIANAETRQVLTIGKSLAEEGSEQRHLDYCKKYPVISASEKNLWPHNFDYFYADIKISPDCKKFLSAGWAWGSSDCCMLFDIDDFIGNTRISAVRIMDGEHEGRYFCFIDNETVATTYNPSIEDEENISEDDKNRYVIKLFACSGAGPVGTIKPDKEYNLYQAQIFHSAKRNGYILFSDELGLLVLGDDGKTLLYEPDTKIAQFDEASERLLQIQRNEVLVKEIVQ